MANTVQKVTQKFDIDFIMEFEGWELTTEQLVYGFADGIKTGQVRSLQGMYWRTAQSIIDAGYVTQDGEVTEYALEKLAE